MIKLFKYDNYQVVIEPEALLLTPFKEIWSRDKSKDKSIASMELGFIYFMCDPRSDYQIIVNKKDRENEIKLAEGLPDEWEPDIKVKEAMAFYESFKPMSAGLIEDTKVAVDKVREFLRNIDMYATDDNGKPIHTISTITNAIKSIPILVKNLEEAERSLNSEILETSRARGNATKTIFEDEFDI